MAAPHGVKLKELNSEFTENTSAEATDGTQDEYGERDVPVFELDVGKTLDGCLGPSILSIFKETTPADQLCNHIDVENEASLLSALTEILDSVDVETLSPFDTLPDAEIFSVQKSQNQTLRKLLQLPSDKATASQGPKLSHSPTSKSGRGVIISDRQLRPRRQLGTQNVTSQRCNVEHNLRVSKCHIVRTFRIESDPIFPQDGPETFVELVRHMHPYCLRTELEDDRRTSDVHVSTEEEVFVDVVGDEEQEENVLVQSELRFPLGQNEESDSCSKAGSNLFLTSTSEMDQGDNLERLKMCPSGQIEDEKFNMKPHRSALVRNSHEGRMKKKVSFAINLTSVYEIPLDAEELESDFHESPVLEDSVGEYCSPGCEDSEIMSSKNDQTCDITSSHNSVKPKSLSLEQYRLLRQKKQLPLDERRMDHRTKWPSILNVPRELLPFLPDVNTPQVNLKTEDVNEKISASSPEKESKSAAVKMKVSGSRRDDLTHRFCREVNRMSEFSIDPPNPAIVPLKPTRHKKTTPTTPSADLSTTQETQRKVQDMQADNILSFPTQPVTLEPPNLTNSDSPASERDVCGSGEDAQVASVVPVKFATPISVTIKPKTSAAGSPTKTESVESSQKRPASVLMTIDDREQQNQTTTGEIGIEATDLSSLLEQFETQAFEGQKVREISPDEGQERWSQVCRLTDLSSTAGLTPPATPPHQIWKLLLPVKGTKHESIKPPTSKPIQIIEARPLPPTKTKHPLPLSTPAPNPSQAFMDHDYCGSQDSLIQRNKRSFTDMNTCSHSVKESRSHFRCRSFSEMERLSGSVLLSPDSSPCRVDSYEGVESLRERSLRYSSRSPSPPGRGRTRRRAYGGGYQRSSSSRSSSCSSCSSSGSSSSSGSRSPPRRRYRSRHSGSSSSSRSSSRSSSCSPLHKRTRQYSRSQSRSRSRSGSFHRSRSGSRSPQRDCRRQRETNRHRRHEEARKIRQQKAIEERRVVYVGGIRRNMSPSDLRDRFSLFGKIEDCTVHFRSRGDNYGFVTYYNTDDAFAAIENGGRLRRVDELPFDICFGGRRQFCKSNYADLDSNRGVDPSSQSRCSSLDFDTLLKQAQRGLKT